MREGRFREDLLARINLWSFVLPGLRSRPEDIEPNLQFELDQFGEKTGRRITFNKEARKKFLDFAHSSDGMWKGNFRDLNGAIVRMATLAPGGRITTEVAEEEIDRLKASWKSLEPVGAEESLAEFLSSEELAKIDLFDRAQLARVVEVCRSSRSLSDAGRILFNVSRERKKSSNDADRIRKYLTRFGIDWNQLQE